MASSIKNPSLEDVRARRADIAKAIGSLQLQDKELAAAESALVRFFGVNDSDQHTPPPPPLPMPPPAAPSPTAAALWPSPTSAPLPPPPTTAAPPSSDEDDGVSVAALLKMTTTGKETLEELIVEMLEACTEDWWSAVEIQQCATEIRGKEVPMSSVSPTLTNMKNKGILVRDGLNVGLASRFQKKEAAAEDSAAAS